MKRIDYTSECAMNRKSSDTATTQEVTFSPKLERPPRRMKRQLFSPRIVIKIGTGIIS